MKTPSEWVINYAKNSYTSSAGRAVKELMECYNEASKEINGLIIGNSELRIEIDRLKEENDSLREELEKFTQNEGAVRNQLKALLNEKESLNAELIKALEWFCNRVDRGEVRSKNSYARFKSLLQKAKDL